MMLQHLVFTVLPAIVELVAVLLVLVNLVTLPFLLLFAGALTCYIAAFAYSATTVTNAARAASAARVHATAVMTDSLMNYEVVKTFTAESLIQGRVEEMLGRCEAEWVRFYRRYAINGVVVSTIFAAFVAMTVCYATEEVRVGRMTLGTFVLLSTYVLQLMRPVEMMGYAVQGLFQGVVMLEKLALLLREPTETAAGGQACPAEGLGALEFDRVCASYEIGRPILKNVSFRVAGGRTMGIVGRSGSGKSTVVRVLLRLLEPNAGRVLVEGSPISGISLQDLRRLIAVVPQDVALFDGSLRYNIGFGRPDASLEEIEAAARIAQLHDFVTTLADGYETVVGERGVKLSGGERQRVSIARAVLRAPKIYVFDEATSSLDSRTEKEILRKLRALSRSHTTLVIAHRLSAVVHADEILVLEDGQVVERGTHESLLRLKGKYAGLWTAQRADTAAM